MSNDDVMDRTFVMRMTTSDREKLDALAKRLPLTATAIARLALRIGLATIEQDPSAIFTAGKPAARRKPTKRST